MLLHFPGSIRKDSSFVHWIRIAFWFALLITLLINSFLQGQAGEDEVDEVDEVDEATMADRFQRIQDLKQAGPGP